MARNDTLKKIYSEIEAGNLGKARDRLHGLMVTYPDDIHIRELLGDLYWRMHLPAMAGRYWYLTETSGVHVETARIAFEKSFGNDPIRIMIALKFRGDPDKLSDQAQKRIDALQEDHIRRHGNRFNWTKAGKEIWRKKYNGGENGKTPIECSVMIAILILIAIILLILIVLGVVWVVQNLF